MDEDSLILIGEDEPDNQVILQTVVESFVGARAEVAADGLAVLASVERERPRMILLDLMMPGLDGFAVCREIQRRHQLPPPVIFVTAHDNTFSRVKGLDAGAVDYLTKPFEAAELLARVRSALRTNALRNRLAAEAATDPLTGLLNRRQLDQRLAETVALAHRHSRPVSALMIDLDHFKRVNDSYGHASGDQVLCDVATRIRESCRISDVVARYGGEEFVVVLPETDVNGAVSAAEKIRWIVSSRPIQLERGGRIRVTASVGAAELERETGTPGQLLADADAALYDAKHAGRDRIASA